MLLCVKKGANVNVQPQSNTVVTGYVFNPFSTRGDILLPLIRSLHQTEDARREKGNLVPTRPVGLSQPKTVQIDL